MGRRNGLLKELGEGADLKAASEWSSQSSLKDQWGMG